MGKVRVRTLSETATAAVLGASGIGRHHVKWLQAAGCAVRGFLGTSAESVARTAAMLQQQYGFAGRGYTDPTALLDEVRPDLVSVCSPMQHHYAHVRACLQAGCHVLCEKPLVLDRRLEQEALLAQGRELVALAAERGRLLAINTQYAAAAPHLQRMCEAAGVAGAPVTQFAMCMASRGRPGVSVYDRIWVDLCSHPISVLLALVPDGELITSSVRSVIEHRTVETEFDYRAADGTLCRTRLITRNVPEGPIPRWFQLNGVQVEYEGRPDEAGVYATFLSAGGREVKVLDFMQESICRFADAVRGRGTVLAGGAAGLRNLELQLALVQGADRR